MLELQETLLHAQGYDLLKKVAEGKKQNQKWEADEKNEKAKNATAPPKGGPEGYASGMGAITIAPGADDEFVNAGDSSKGFATFGPSVYCQPICTCNGGEPSEGFDCSFPMESCEECNYGYALVPSPNKTVNTGAFPKRKVMVCTPNVCKCPHNYGPGAIGAECSKHGSIGCGKCYQNLAGWRKYNASSGLCGPVCTCQFGIAADPFDAEEAKWCTRPGESCIRCARGYHLVKGKKPNTQVCVINECQCPTVKVGNRPAQIGDPAML